jgi:PST family polysaccharide transporter
VIGADTEGEVGRKAARGLAWSTVETILVRLLSLVTFVVVTRLLMPADYGIAAIAGAVATVFALLAAGGYARALVQRPDLTDDEIDAVFWCSLGLGCVVAAIVAGLAQPLAALLDTPELRLVVLATTPLFLAHALSSVPNGLLARDFQFRLLARISILANLVVTVAGMLAALAGAGYWALVLQIVVGPLVGCACLWFVCPYRPARRASLASFRAILPTSRPIMGYQVLGLGNDQLDKLLVGVRLDGAVLGVYTVASRAVAILLELVSRPFQVVAQSTFARLAGHPESLARAYEQMVRLNGVVALPLFAIGAALAEPATAVLLGDRWLGAVPVIQVLCAYAALHWLFEINAALLQATGAARAAFRCAVAGTLLQLLLIVVALPHGIAWVAAAFVARTVLVTPIAIGLAARHTGVALRVTVVGVGAPLLSAGCAAGLVLGIDALTDLDDIALLCVATPGGALTYLAMLAAIGRSHLGALRRVGALMRA